MLVNNFDSSLRQFYHIPIGNTETDNQQFVYAFPVGSDNYRLYIDGNNKKWIIFDSYIKAGHSNIRSRHHIIGSDYAYVTECNYNRKAFVYCMIESFSGFADNDLISSMDMLQLIESIILKFPRSVVMEAALSIENAGGDHSFSSVSSSTSVRFYFRDMSSAICFHVLFEDWLKLVEKIFRDEGAMNCLSAYRVKESLDNVSRFAS